MFFTRKIPYHSIPHLRMTVKAATEWWAFAITSVWITLAVSQRQFFLESSCVIALIGGVDQKVQ